jgi:hypothetical protein
MKKKPCNMVRLKKYSNETSHPRYRLKWGSTRFTLLGIQFDVELGKIPQLNYSPKITKLDTMFCNNVMDVGM